MYDKELAREILNQIYHAAELVLERMRKPLLRGEGQALRLQPVNNLEYSMSLFKKPCQTNAYLSEHVDVLRASLRHYTGRDLIDSQQEGLEAAREIFYAPFVVLSHNTAKDPVFTYGNQAALELFEMSWDELLALPSRKSAEIPDRDNYQDRSGFDEIALLAGLSK